MKKSIKINKNSTLFIFLSGMILGLICFIAVYGIKILNPTYDSWCLNSTDDLIQHYLGWIAYRNAKWTFPLCLTDALSYPSYQSVMYVDCIPIFCIFFKLLSPILPATFQFFGLFGLTCFMLMGGFAAILLNHFIKQPHISLICSVMYILTGYCLRRMFIHTALSAQWVIPAALYLWLCVPKNHQKVTHKALRWTLLLAFCSMTQMYLAPIVLGFLGCDLLENFVEEKGFINKVKRPLICGLISGILGIVGAMYLIGGFYGNVESSNTGLGLTSANLNTLINSTNGGIILPDLPQFYEQIEGYGYLGISVILLLIFGIIRVFFHKEILSLTSFTKIRLSILALICVVFMIVAASNKVCLGETVLFTIPLPRVIEKVWSIVRSSGRFVWGIDYSLMTLACVFFFMPINATDGQTDSVVAYNSRPLSYRKPALVFALAACLTTLQLYDLSDLLSEYHNKPCYSVQSEYASPLSDQWDDLIAAHPHVQIFPYGYENRQMMFAIGAKALKQQGTISTFFFSRPNGPTIKATCDEITQELNQGIVRDDMLYVFESLEDLDRSWPLNYFELDNFIIGTR